MNLNSFRILTPSPSESTCGTWFFLLSCTIDVSRIPCTSLQPVYNDCPNIYWNFKERMVRSLLFIFGRKGFLNVTIFGTGASSIREATPFATPTNFLPPSNPYCVSTVVEFLITHINKLYDYNTASVCVLSTSPCWAVSKSGDNRLFRYA